MRRQRIFPALLCGAALFAFACGGDREAERVDAETETKPAETWQIVDEPAEEPAQDTAALEPNELRPESREVQIEPRDLERDDLERETELEERERQLAERQAEVAARERELRERETRAEARRTPAPRPERPERIEEPEPDTAEPAPAEDTEEVADNREAERFEEEAPPEPVEEERAERTSTRVATVPSGTVLEAELLQELSSSGSAVGDTFRARLVSDVLEEGGQVAIPEGAEVVGVVEEAVPLTRRVGGKAKLTLRFTDLVLPSGATVPIRASLIEQGRSETRKDAATIGGAAAGGAILGRIFNGKDRSKGAVIGAIIGAAAGTVIASRTPGEEVVFPEGTVINLNLDQDAEVRSRRQP